VPGPTAPGQAARPAPPPPRDRVAQGSARTTAATRPPAPTKKGQQVRPRPDAPFRQQELLHLLGWFIRVRWLFLAGLGVAILAGARVFHFAFPIEKILAVGLAVLSYNVLLASHHRVLLRGPLPLLMACRLEAGLQIGLDLIALTSLIHLAGGAENPFIGFYLFHVIVGSAMLPKREAWLVGLAAFGLFAAVVALEYAEVLPHYPPIGFTEISRYRDAPFLLVVTLAFMVTLFSSISITSSIVNTLRLRERQLVLVQKALLENSQELERACATLTQRQEQLVQTEKQASLGQLVAGIAHEINNPIQFIYGNMGILSEAFGDVLPLLDERNATRPDLRIARLDYPYFREQVPILLKDMSDGAARIGAIVRDLKTFARRDEDRLDENVDLNEAVQASLRLLHPQLRHLHVEEDLHPGLPKIRGNRTKLQQVVMNTVQNAAEATGTDHQGRIKIRTRPEGRGEQVRLSIEDNGCGIAPEVKDRIFDPFFTTKQRSGGTGLGLSITYGIIQQHRGRIVVESESGTGTSFHFILPATVEGAA
jgi:signal transduction histidine kinase